MVRHMAASIRRGSALPPLRGLRGMVPFTCLPHVRLRQPAVMPGVDVVSTAAAQPLSLGGGTTRENPISAECACNPSLTVLYFGIDSGQKEVPIRCKWPDLPHQPTGVSHTGYASLE
ncbi:hypothetical protein GCM10028802_39680 [Terrabacter terrigena]